MLTIKTARFQLNSVNKEIDEIQATEMQPFSVVIVARLLNLQIIKMECEQVIAEHAYKTSNTFKLVQDRKAGV